MLVNAEPVPSVAEVAAAEGGYDLGGGRLAVVEGEGNALAEERVRPSRIPDQQDVGQGQSCLRVKPSNGVAFQGRRRPTFGGPRPRQEPWQVGPGPSHMNTAVIDAPVSCRPATSSAAREVPEVTL